MLVCVFGGVFVCGFLCACVFCVCVVFVLPVCVHACVHVHVY